jgi:lipopolysaccharide export system permease protein
MRIIPAYVRNIVISAIFIVTITLVGIESFMEFVNELPDIGKQDYGIVQATLYVLMQLPSDIYQLFPIAGFLGGLLGIGRLATNSELIVMRASGVSVIRIAMMVAKTALILLFLMSVIGEWWAPRLQYQANIMKLNDLHKQVSEDQRELWFRHGHSFLHLEHVLSPNQVADIINYAFNANNELVSTTRAEYAKYIHHHWELYHVAVSNLTENKITTLHFKQTALDFDFKPILLQQLNRDPDQENLIELWKNIKSHHQAGLLATRFELNFWQRVLQPITIFVMICLGVPFVFGSLRQASTGARIIVGITVGFGFYMINRFIGPLTLVYQWPPYLVAALPPTLFMSLCIFLLYRAR